jgi:hypothetical protein
MATLDSDEEEVASLGGLPPKGIAGRFVARSAAPAEPELMAAAAAQRDGWLYVIDLRTPEGPQGRVPPEDIIGAFEVRTGQINGDWYQPFSDYRVYSQNGPPMLPHALRRAFVAQLRVDRDRDQRCVQGY